MITEDFKADRARELIETDSLDAVILFSQDFDQKVSALLQGRIDVYFKSRDIDIARRRLWDLFDAFEKRLVSDRFERLNLNPMTINPLTLEKHDVTSTEEKIGKRIGGFLPYIFVLFCVMGCMYPAIDLGAGEKERGTLETLLASPASRIQILLGKFGVVVLAGILSAAVSLAGLFLAIRQIKEIPPELMDVVSRILELTSIGLVLSLLLPLTIFFSAGLLAISIFARSFKEAQNLMTPMSIVIIVPVFIGFLPGITLNTTTALIPILNVTLASKEIFAQTISPGLLTEVYVSLLVLAGLSLYGCAKWFEREETMFRGS